LLKIIVPINNAIEGIKTMKILNKNESPEFDIDIEYGKWKK
jgi:hypothetical protein